MVASTVVRSHGACSQGCSHGGSQPMALRQHTRPSAGPCPALLGRRGPTRPASTHLQPKCEHNLLPTPTYSTTVPVPARHTDTNAGTAHHTATHTGCWILAAGGTASQINVVRQPVHMHVQCVLQPLARIAVQASSEDAKGGSHSKYCTVGNAVFERGARVPETSVTSCSC